jgi:hypothetical protein
MTSNRTYVKGLVICAVVAVVSLLSSGTAQAQQPFGRPLWGPPPVEVRPGGYVPVPGTWGRVGYNPVTGSTYVPGRAAIKQSGVYRPIGNGVYMNPWSGNVYVPSTGVYIRR